MGTGVSLVAFRGVADVPSAVTRAENALRDVGLVAGEHDPEAVLAWQKGLVLRPGPKAAVATGYGEQINELLTNGVTFIGARYFNAYALGFGDWFGCPMCAGRVSQDDSGFGDQMSNLGFAAGDWCEGKDDATAQCLLCAAAVPITDWKMEDPVFLADMVVEFWNWPYLDRDATARAQWWHVDVVPILEDAVGAPAMLSGYKI